MGREKVPCLGMALNSTERRGQAPRARGKLKRWPLQCAASARSTVVPKEGRDVAPCLMAVHGLRRK
jgi:hypothetical protein